MSEEFDWQKRSKEYNERNNIIFKGDMNDKREFDTFFNTLYQPKEGQNIGILGEKYLILLQEKNKSEKRPEGQFLIDPDLIRDVLDCMGYDRTDVIKYKAYGDLLCDQIFDFAVNEVSKQQNPNILFLTGNPAAGKGHALKDESISAELNLNGHSIIYDSPMGDFKWGSKQIKELIDKNFKVDYVQIYNDFQTSYKNMIDRGLKEGRFVEFEIFLKSFKRQENRTFDILDILKEDIKDNRFNYKGINCSDNIIKDKILDLAKIVLGHKLDTYKKMMFLSISPQKSKYESFLNDYNRILFGKEESFLIDWGVILSLVNSIYNDYSIKLSKKYSQLNDIEKKTCILLKIGFSFTEIAGILDKSIHTIYKYSSIIRKKLSIPEDENIIEFIDENVN